MKFKTPKPDSLEIIPTVFITLDALRSHEGNEGELARRITKRALNMCSYNDLGPVQSLTRVDRREDPLGQRDSGQVRRVAPGVDLVHDLLPAAPHSHR